MCAILKTPTHIPDYETIQNGPHTILLKPEWKGRLLEDLLSDFRNVDARKSHAGGRVEHFSYLPRGSSDRVFVRRAARGGALGSLLQGLYLGVDRPMRELAATSAARRAGVSVAEPLAVRATRVGPFRRFTIVSREIQNASNLLVLGPSLPPAEKRAITIRVADEMRRMHEAGVYHADLTVRNILVSGGTITIIDLDNAFVTAGRVRELDIMNLSRLNRSVEKMLGPHHCITRTDKLRFLCRYLGENDRLREMARACGSGLWVHRLWWSLSGQS